jgi:hypothetical protein
VVVAVVLLLVLPVVWMMQAFSRTTSRQQERPGVNRQDLRTMYGAIVHCRNHPSAECFLDSNVKCQCSGRQLKAGHHWHNGQSPSRTRQSPLREGGCS